jgi:hypothetical protein
MSFSEIRIRAAGITCHPDEASNASDRKDLGQLRDSEAGSGFEIAQRSLARGTIAERVQSL